MPGQSPAPATAAPKSTSLQLASGEPNPQQCLTPPSVRRREARIARCMVIQDARRAAAAATAEAEQGEPEPGRRDPATRHAHTPEEVRIRRRDHHREQQRILAAAAAATEGDHLDRNYGRLRTPGSAAAHDPALLIRPDGTVNWDAAPSAVPVEFDAATLATLQDLPALPLQGPAEAAGPLTLSPPAFFEHPAGWPSPALLLSAFLVVLHLVQGRRSRRRSSAAEADAPARKYSAARPPGI